MGSLHHFWDAVQAFGARLGGVAWGALAGAVALHLLNLVLRTRAWRNIIAASVPEARVPWPSVFGAYSAGVGINGVVPARAGDVTKLLLVHRRVPQAGYPTLASGLAVETLFDLVVGTALLVWAFGAGHLPSLPSLPSMPAFEWSFLADHPTATVIGLILAAFAAVVVVTLLGHRVRRFWARVADGLAILRTPRRYLTRVVAYQAAGWGTRVGTAWLFLDAFHVPASLTTALLVMVVQGAATSMPLTPGGIGPKQALTVVVLAGVAPSSALLAFSVGMELATLVVNLVLGLACMAVMLRGFRFRQAIAAGRAEQAEAGAPAQGREPAKRGDGSR